MNRNRIWKTAVITLAALGTAWFGAMAGSAALAQSSEESVQASSIAVASDQSEEDDAVHTLEAAVDLLMLVDSELADDVLADASPPEWPVIAAYVVNILEGPQGPHFREEYALPSLIYDRGAIAYVEELVGISADEFGDADVAALIDSGAASPEEEVLLRLMYANELLVGDAVDIEVLAAAADQVNAVLTLLQNVVVH